MTSSIQEILARSDASLCLEAADPMRTARMRAAVTKRIAAAYPLFESLRDSLLGRRSVKMTAEHRALQITLGNAGLIELVDGAGQIIDHEARRYLTGGWLEEYVALAVAELGADEVLTGQKITWRAGEFVGENEIDVVARFGDRLFLCSCKALRSNLAPDDVRTREHLMNALHEADNLADHFAPDAAIVALAVTTDLFDERTREPRYEQLHGKAEALRVGLVTLEHMPWPTMLKRLTALLATAAVAV